LGRSYLYRLAILIRPDDFLAVSRCSQRSQQLPSSLGIALMSSGKDPHALAVDQGLEFIALKRASFQTGAGALARHQHRRDWWVELPLALLNTDPTRAYVG
jgi:hypothetical protein